MPLPDLQSILSRQQKNDVKTAHQRWQSNRLRPYPADVKLLFDIYNQFVHRYPKDKGCPSCVQFIFNFWKKTIEQWPANP